MQSKTLPTVHIDSETDGRYFHFSNDSREHTGRVQIRVVPGHFVFIDYIEVDTPMQRQGYGTSVLAQLAAKHQAEIAPVKENSTGFWRALRAKPVLPFVLGDEVDEDFVTRTMAGDSDSRSVARPRMR